MLDTALIAFLIASNIAVPPPPPVYRIARQPVQGGAELITLFGTSPSLQSGTASLDVPLLSVLRDNLGSPDPESARLRYVWILTSTRPTALQRAASALSFVWVRTEDRQHSGAVPSPALDLASPSRTVWTNLVANIVQSSKLDSLGAPIRSSTRSYRGNSSDYRSLQTFRALGALDQLERDGLKNNSTSSLALPPADLHELYSRLSLSGRTLGGLLRSEKLAEFYDQEAARRSEMRGHNWELLRQRAEESGLIFEPLALRDSPPAEALLWVSRADLERRQHTAFERQFLNISNPWTDERLLHWTGYTETRYFDAEHRPVPQGTPGAQAVELIPLALYSLDHPRVPLLLVDFRSSLNAKRRELLHQGSNAVLTGLLGITGFGNWSFLAANSAWTFVSGRHGAPTDHSARLRSYSEAREFLASGAGLQPELRAELLRRLDHLALNPRENGLQAEDRVAKEQYAALARYAESPTGLATRLAHDRQKELDAHTHSRARRLLATAGRLFGNPAPRDPEKTASTLAALRRNSAHIRYLEQVLASSPRPEVVRDPAEIRRVIEALAADPARGPRGPQLIAEIFARSQDFWVRMACLESLQRLDIQEARNQLVRLSNDPSAGDLWRALSLAYLNADPEVSAASAGGQP